MADTTEPEKPKPGDQPRKRPAFTIDLTATEIKNETDQTASQSSAGGAGDPAGPKPSAWLPSNVPWPMAIAAGGGALVVLLLVGLLALVGVIGPQRDDAAVMATRLAPIESQLRELTGRPAPATVDPKSLDELAARLARAEATLAAPRTPVADPAVQARLDAAESAVRALLDNTASLKRRSDDGAAALREVRERLDGLLKSFAELSQTLSQRSQSAGTDHAEIERLVGRVAALERTGKTIETELEKRTEHAISDRAIRLAVAASALKSAVDRGAPFAAELSAARPLAADARVLDPLTQFATTGVPAAAALSRELSALAPSLLRAPGAAPGDGGLLDRLQANASRLVRVRPVDEAPGDDPASIVARVEARAGRADIAGALAELGKLSVEQRKPAEAWIKKAEASVAATTAAQSFAADAFAALGKPAP